MPVVSIGDSLVAARTAGAVLFDNRAGVTLPLEHLAALGHRSLAVRTPTHAGSADRPAEANVTAEAGRLRVPEDVSIMGYDAHSISGPLNPALATVDWDIDGVVAAAVRMILEAVDGTHRRQGLTRRPTLLARSSAAPPAGRSR
ncbi:MAG: hypothetical protein QOE61_820 [Micromonosporaceae bacterium]|nr:hypothetical protein [Micromonosporaceae bacterium]